MRDLKPPPNKINAIVNAACKSIALNGVFLVLCSFPNMAGKYRSRPATKIKRADVKVAPEMCDYMYDSVNNVIAGHRLILPLRAPKHEKATMNANTVPPIGPKRALPKSSATVLLRATVFSSACQILQHVTLNMAPNYLIQDNKIRHIS